jgi:hypothetical protein
MSLWQQYYEAVDAALDATSVNHDLDAATSSLAAKGSMVSFPNNDMHTNGGMQM